MEAARISAEDDGGRWKVGKDIGGGKPHTGYVIYPDEI